MGSGDLLSAHWATASKASVASGTKRRLFGTFSRLFLFDNFHASVVENHTSRLVVFNRPIVVTYITSERKKQQARRQLSNEINTLSKVVVAKYQELYSQK